MNSIKFLGTAGARFVMIEQIRASGGIWLTLDGTKVLIDPGPGSLVRCLTSKPRLNPKEIDGIILTHRHLDHSNDVNIMIEAMTDGGTKKRGVVFAPHDALESDPVILRYVRGYLQSIEILEEKKNYRLGTIQFSTPVKHIHGSETYGLNIKGGGHFISLISDTRYFKELPSYYPGEILIINVVRLENKPGIDHLCVSDVEEILKINHPRICILTHFGMSMIKAKPWKIAERLTDKTKIKVISAQDGMNINLDEV
ncbi:MAG: MBL fold metallo-hydrolase [Candidatus Thermoplasmatota archaeon]